MGKVLSLCGYEALPHKNVIRTLPSGALECPQG